MLLLCLLAGALARPPLPPAIPLLDAAAYARALDDTAAAVARLRSADDARRLDAALPSEWRVGGGTADTADTAEIDIPLDWLHADLGTFARLAPASQSQAEAAAIRAELFRRLAWMRQDEATSPAPENAAAARGRLDQILRRRAFRSVAPPSYWQLLLVRFWIWLGEWLESIFGHLGLGHGTGLALVIVLIVAASAGLLALLLNIVNRPPRERPSMPALPPVLHSWQERRRRAQLHAQRGDWPGCLQCAYAAAAALLADRNRWRLDAARTPREYTALLPEADPARQPWDALAADLEAVSYAAQPATPSAAAAALAHLDRLLSLLITDN